MDATLMGIGVACILAAIVGGGLEAVGIKFPVVSSIRRQVLMAMFGMGVFSLGWMGSRANSPAPSVTPTQVQNDLPTPDAAAAEGEARPPVVQAGPASPPMRTSVASSEEVSKKGANGDSGQPANQTATVEPRPNALPPSAPTQEDLNGIWQDINDNVWRIRQTGTRFTLTAASGNAGTRGEGYIDGKSIALRVWIGSALHVCEATLSPSSASIGGSCTAASGGGQFRFRWDRRAS